jgi:hypothetical protein
MMIAYTNEDGHFLVYQSDVQGADVESIDQSTDVDPVQLAVLDRSDGFSAILLTGSGRVLRYETRSRWSPVGDKITAIAFPG